MVPVCGLSRFLCCVRPCITKALTSMSIDVQVSEMTSEATQFDLKRSCLNVVRLCLCCPWLDRIDRQADTLLTANRFMIIACTYKHITRTAAHHHTQPALWSPGTLFHSRHVSQQHGGMEELWVFKYIQSTRKAIANEYNSAIITSKITHVKLDIVGTRKQYSIHQLLLRKHSGYFQKKSWLACG